MKNMSLITQIHLKDFEIMFVLSKKKKEKKKHGLNHQLHLKDCEILLDLCKKKKKYALNHPTSPQGLWNFVGFVKKKKHLPNESPNSTSRIIKFGWFCLNKNTSSALLSTLALVLRPWLDLLHSLMNGDITFYL